MPEPTAAAYPAETEAPAEPAWSLSQDEWQQTQETLAALNEYVQQAPRVVYPGQQQQEAQPEYDPYDPESIRNLIRSEIAPFAQTHQHIREAEVDEWKKDVLTDLKARDGDFDMDVAE